MYWIVSTALLMLAVLLVAILAHNAARVQRQTVGELVQRVAALEARARTAEERQPFPPPPSTTRPVGAEVLPAAKPAEQAPRTSSGPAPPAAAVPSEQTIRARLDALLPDTAIAPADITDRPLATELIESSMEYVRRAPWSGQTWTRLAVLARLLDRGAAAEAYAARAAAAGDPAPRYAEVSARYFLAHRQPREALPYASYLVEQGGGGPAARVLLASAWLGTGEPASADEVVASIGPAAVLTVGDRLRLARLLLSLERWDELAAALETISRAPDGLTVEHNLLLAASLARSGRTVEALGILDWLADQPRPAPASRPAWPLPTPDGYEIAVWRGVALTLAGQPEAARQALLRAAELRPGEPGAHYYLGVLEAREGRPEIAMSYLKNALAASQRMAPAWEAMALLEIDGGQIDLALEHLRQAIEINPRRASAHFLAAIAQAKLSAAQPTAEALRQAFRLDRGYLEAARQTEVILRLFTPGELEALAAEPAEEATP